MSRRRAGPSPSDFLMCRTLGHAWDEIASDGPAVGGDPWWLRCVRCSTERHDVVSWMTGELIGRSYVYADGYRHAFDDEFDVAPTGDDGNPAGSWQVDNVAKVQLSRTIAALAGSRIPGLAWPWRSR